MLFSLEKYTTRPKPMFPPLENFHADKKGIAPLSRFFAALFFSLEKFQHVAHSEKGNTPLPRFFAALFSSLDKFQYVA